MTEQVIRRVAEKACLNLLAVSLTAAGHPEFASEVAGYIPSEPPECLEVALGDESAGTNVVARLVLATITRGQVQSVGVNSRADAEKYIRGKRILLGAATSWVGAFSAGSPELASKYAQALGQPAGPNGEYRLTLQPANDYLTAYVFRPEDAVEISVATTIIFPDGRVMIPPVDQSYKK